MKRAYRALLTADRLRELFRYDYRTGVFTRRVRAGNRLAGEVAGNSTNGYIEIGIDGVSYKAHRLAWLYVYGHWPNDQLDHRDLVRSNNRLSNLRQANNTQNNCNQPIRTNNTSGYKGVSFCKQTGRWAARIRAHGKKIHIGRFETPYDAHLAYTDAANNLHGAFANA